MDIKLARVINRLSPFWAALRSNDDYRGLWMGILYISSNYVGLSPTEYVVY